MAFVVDSPYQTQTLTTPETNEAFEILSKTVEVGPVPARKKKIRTRTCKSQLRKADLMTHVPGTSDQSDVVRTREHGTDEESTTRIDSDEVKCIRVSQSRNASSFLEAIFETGKSATRNKHLWGIFAVVFLTAVLGFLKWFSIVSISSYGISILVLALHAAVRSGKLKNESKGQSLRSCKEKKNIAKSNLLDDHELRLEETDLNQTKDKDLICETDKNIKKVKWLFEAI